MRFYAGQILHRTQIGVEVERLAQRHIDTGRATGDGRGHGPLQRNAIFSHRFHGQLADELSAFRGLVGASFELFPIDLDTRSFQDTTRGRGHFRPDAFAGNQCDFVSHRGIYCKRSV